MRTELFDYELPADLIAQSPAPRGTARMLVLHRHDGLIEHRQVCDLPDYLTAGDVLALNDTRVSARRLEALRENGLPAEVFLLRRTGATRWEALVHPGKALRPGRTLQLIGPTQDEPPVTALVVDVTPDGGRTLEIAASDVGRDIATWGVTPLPPYIGVPLPADQESCYQTVYARHNGSAAAPTAGLHFTVELLDRLANIGVARADITLHVGIDTFRPVRSLDIEEHRMHGEIVSVSAEAADVINRAPGRVVAVGTTSVRALETAAGAERTANRDATPRVRPFHGESRLFITPGYTFRAVDAMLTNFHLPKSTLLMLISALAGRDAVMDAYAEAIRLKYRFYSFGDAMLIL